jgi:hypothetical protein
MLLVWYLKAVPMIIKIDWCSSQIHCNNLHSRYQRMNCSYLLSTHSLYQVLEWTLPRCCIYSILYLSYSGFHSYSPLFVKLVFSTLLFLYWLHLLLSGYPDGSSFIIFRCILSFIVINHLSDYFQICLFISNFEITFESYCLRNYFYLQTIHEMIIDPLLLLLLYLKITFLPNIFRWFFSFISLFLKNICYLPYWSHLWKEDFSWYPH